MKACVYCGKEFKPRRKNQIYCSDKCKHDIKNDRQKSKYEYKEYEHKCHICNKPFISSSPAAKYCSDECKKTAHWTSKEYDLKCEVCGENFKAWTLNQKYCSEECRNKAEYKKWEYKRYELECKICGKKFIANQSKYKYCSDECREIASAKYRYLHDNTCVICGNSFKAKTNSYKYCSEECKEEAKIRRSNKSLKRTHKKVKGETIKELIEPKVTFLIDQLSARLENNINHFSIDFRHIKMPGSIREEVVKRDGRECQICGSKINLHVHHIIPRRNGGDHGAENLITLCSKCHMHIETGDKEHAINKCTNNTIKVLNNYTDPQSNITHKEIIEKQNRFIIETFNKLSEYQNLDYGIKEILCSIDDFLS